MVRFILLGLTAVLVLQSEFKDEAEYKKDMQEIDHAFTELRKDRPIRQGPELEREASRLATLFGDVEEFWKGRGDDEAAGFARMAKNGAEEAGKASRNGDSKAFEAALDTIAASCEGCHHDPLDKYRLRLSE